MIYKAAVNVWAFQDVNVWVYNSCTVSAAVLLRGSLYVKVWAQFKAKKKKKKPQKPNVL